MASMNRVVIMGNLGSDPELRYTASQTPVCTLSVATTEYRQGADGQRQEQTEWHRVVVWSKAAENCAKYLSKGRSVLVEGRLTTRSYEDKQGQKRYTTEIIAQNVQFIGGAPQGRGTQPGQTLDDGAPSSGGYGANSGGGYAGGLASGRQSQQQHQPSSHDEFSGSGGGTGFGGPETPGLDDIPF